MKILEPVKVGSMELKNRIMFPPLTTGYEERDGSIGPQSDAFYTRLAKGGAGYLVLGDVAPVRSFTPTPKLYEDSQIEGFEKLAEHVHKYGAKIAGQIFHPEYDCDQINALFASGEMAKVRERVAYDMQHFVNEVSGEQLMIIIEKMCDCAKRLQKAGFDAVQVHGDRLTGALCSIKMNNRTDQFGGSLENRTRFALELVKQLKRAVPGMAIDYKLSIILPERGKGGIDVKEAPQFAQWLEDAGVDMLHVAQGNHTGNLADTIPPMGVQPYGFFVERAAEIKKAVTIPVSAVGRIIDPDMAECIVAGEKADIVAVGRPLLADPDWIQKIKSGNKQDIRRCISCNKGCTDSIQNRTFVNCILNAENGYEQTRKIVPAQHKKIVAVIGGGPAGLEAARVCAKRGHKVDLYEKTAVLGGQLNLAAVPPRKGEVRRAVQDLIHEVLKEGVTVHVGEEITAEQIVEKHMISPDAVIVATGAENYLPPISGTELTHVCDAWNVLQGKQIVYGKVIVIGGGLVGCETAEYLAEQGCNVTIVEMLDKIAAGESVTVLPTLLENLKNRQTVIHTGTKVQEISRDKVVCVDANGKTIQIICNYVVMAAGAKSCLWDTAALENAGIQVIKIGDCAGRAADIGNAIRTGYDAGNQI